MRLSYYELHSITGIFKEVFGEGTIYLFGSRVDDSQKGGDIDLFLDVDGTEDLFEKKINFVIKVQEKIGEQKIDVVFAKESNRAIETAALTTGIELNMDKIKLEKYFHECDKHIQRIEEAYGDIKASIPLSADDYVNLGKESVQAIDQYLFRFAKLQDTMGDKIFKLILSFYEDSTNEKPFLDILNHLEKLGYIASAKMWINLRKIRNNIAHQYDDEPEEMSQAINVIVTHKEVMINIYNQLKAKYMNDLNDG